MGQPYGNLGLGTKIAVELSPGANAYIIGCDGVNVPS